MKIRGGQPGFGTRIYPRGRPTFVSNSDDDPVAATVPDSAWRRFRADGPALCGGYCLGVGKTYLPIRMVSAPSCTVVAPTIVISSWPVTTRLSAPQTFAPIAATSDLKMSQTPIKTMPFARMNVTTMAKATCLRRLRLPECDLVLDADLGRCSADWIGRDPIVAQESVGRWTDQRMGGKIAVAARVVPFTCGRRFPASRRGFGRDGHG
jgi:hypothetical protein